MSFTNKWYKRQKTLQYLNGCFPVKEIKTVTKIRGYPPSLPSPLIRKRLNQAIPRVYQWHIDESDQNSSVFVSFHKSSQILKTTNKSNLMFSCNTSSSPQIHQHSFLIANLHLSQNLSKPCTRWPWRLLFSEGNGRCSHWRPWFIKGVGGWGSSAASGVSCTQYVWSRNTGRRLRGKRRKWPARETCVEGSRGSLWRVLRGRVSNCAGGVGTGKERKGC